MLEAKFVSMLSTPVCNDLKITGGPCETEEEADVSAAKTSRSDPGVEAALPLSELPLQVQGPSGQDVPTIGWHLTSSSSELAASAARKCA